MTNQTNQKANQNEELSQSTTTPTAPKELGLYATGGALAGVGISHIGGGIALAGATTAAFVGMLPVIAIGSAVGIAAYGVKNGLLKMPKFSAPKKTG